MNPYNVVRQFENALCAYTGAPYAVATNSCTNALLLACQWHKVKEVTIPKRTYISVPMTVIQAGGKLKFDDRTWAGMYQLTPYPIWDSARYLTSDMYEPGQFICLSFHWKKVLDIGQGGAILHDNDEADEWFRKARFHGRTEGVEPKNDNFTIMGWHAYMRPSDAADGLMRLSFMPSYNPPLPNDDYPDLSKLKIFGG